MSQETEQTPTSRQWSKIIDPAYRSPGDIVTSFGRGLKRNLVYPIIIGSGLALGIFAYNGTPTAAINGYPTGSESGYSDSAEKPTATAYPTETAQATPLQTMLDQYRPTAPPTTRPFVPSPTPKLPEPPSTDPDDALNAQDELLTYFPNQVVTIPASKLDVLDEDLKNVPGKGYCLSRGDPETSSLLTGELLCYPNPIPNDALPDVSGKTVQVDYSTSPDAVFAVTDANRTLDAAFSRAIATGDTPTIERLFPQYVAANIEGTGKTPSELYQGAIREFLAFQYNSAKLAKQVSGKNYFQECGPLKFCAEGIGNVLSAGQKYGAQGSVDILASSLRDEIVKYVSDRSYDPVNTYGAVDADSAINRLDEAGYGHLLPDSVRESVRNDLRDLQTNSLEDPTTDP
ncbi:MAG: hypothetical protein HY832_03710 [Candidatus Aenigmarchaeota archaeon]|nr:hypothetical protein [Candidatus Aenigmarchaeota archaeon]